MRRIERKIPDFMKGILIKDLQENEVICKHCDGTGLEIKDNVYGIQGEKSTEHFPYKQQSIGFCQHCYNGVIKTCRYCDKELDRNSSKCDCKGYEEAEDIRIEQERERIFEKARKMTYEEYEKEFPDHMVYDDISDEFYTDLDTLLDRAIGEVKYVYGTYVETMSLNIDNIIENACDELHEDAYNNIDGHDELAGAIEKFNLLNKSNTATFYPDYSIAIVL